VEGLSARIAAHPGPRPSISLGFELANTGERSWSGTVFEPVIPWDLRAYVGGEPVRVRQPALDIGVRPRRIRLAPGESTELPSPIVLVFEEEPDSPRTWSLATPPPDAVELEATLTISGEQVELSRTTVRLP
jgi:hypothetical protein